MPTTWILLATALYVFPLVLAYFAAPRDQPSLVTALFRVTLALAVDVGLLSAIGTFVSIAHAALATRVIYVVAFVGWRIRNRGRIARVAHDVRGTVVALTTAAIAVSAYVGLSWHYVIWDRQWHVPLVASLEGQSLPLHNVYNGSALPYHLGGDLIAAQLRALSLDHLSSAASLSLAHDLFIGLGVAWIILLARALGSRSTLVPALGALALALHGAIPRLVGPLGKDEPFFPFAQVSYRPHVPISFFASIMLVGAIMTRVRAPDVRGVRRGLAAAVFVATTCDEASVGIFGVALGLVWLAFPRVLGRTRAEGLGVLGVLLLCVLVPNLFITQTVGHGSAVRSASWVAPRWAGMEGEETPVFSARGLYLGLIWLAAPLTAAVTLSLARLRGRDGTPGAAIGFVWASLLIGCTLAACLLVNGSAGEAQRFYIAPFVGPLTCLVLLAPTLHDAAKVFSGVVMGIPALLTVYNDADIAERLRFSEYTAGNHDTNMPLDLFTTDCHDVTHAPFGERPQHVYVDRTGFRLYSSCRSLYVPGNVHAGWGIAMDVELGAQRQREMVGKFSTRATGVAACWRNRSSDDVCTDLKARGRCQPGNTMFTECDLDLPP